MQHPDKKLAGTAENVMNPAIVANKFIYNKPSARLNRGFTLIEIMVVVAIIAILGAAVVPLVMDRPDQARQVKAKQDIKSMEAALDLYRLDNFNYPSTDQGLEALVQKPTGDPEPANWKDGGYLKQLAKDPWGREYIYISPGETGDFDIISLGRDGQEGGSGYDEDLTQLSD